MKNQVLSFEQMNHLKELGVDVSSASMKLISDCPSSDCYDGTTYVPVDKSFHSKMYNEMGLVFTFQDIINLLPKVIRLNKFKYSPELECHMAVDILWNTLQYECRAFSTVEIPILTKGSNLLDAAYNMLVYCAENKHLNNK